MIKQTKAIFCILATSLILATIAAPAPVQAGTMTIYNKNCTHTKGFKRKNWVTVYVYGPRKCTNKTLRINKGQSKTIELKEEYLSSGAEKYFPCRYNHEAKGTAFGKNDVYGDKHSSVTCKRDWARVCQCTKD